VHVVKLSQQGWVGSPHAAHWFVALGPMQARSSSMQNQVPRSLPKQQASPSSPHATQVLFRQTSDKFSTGSLHPDPMAQQGWPSPPHVWPAAGDGRWKAPTTAAATPPASTPSKPRRLCVGPVARRRVRRSKVSGVMRNPFGGRLGWGRDRRDHYRRDRYRRHRDRRDGDRRQRRHRDWWNRNRWHVNRRDGDRGLRFWCRAETLTGALLTTGP
jgi:hypothetical protein